MFEAIAARGEAAAAVTDQAWLQAMLDAEAALARALASAGVIADEVAETIAAACVASNFDAAQIAADKRLYRDEWLAHDPKGRVNPQRFFDALRARLPDDGIVVADDGNHTFPVAELMPIRAPRTFFSPSDFNSMG